MGERFSSVQSSPVSPGSGRVSSNAAAIDVLRQEIAAGKRKIAIFYGAAHMNDFDTRLREDFQLEPVETDWIEAWDLRLPVEK